MNRKSKVQLSHLRFPFIARTGLLPMPLPPSIDPMDVLAIIESNLVIKGAEPHWREVWGAEAPSWNQRRTPWAPWKVIGASRGAEAPWRRIWEAELPSDMSQEGP